MKKAILLVLVCLVGATAVYADESFKPTAQVRYRFESGGRDFDKSTGNRNFSLLRSRLGMTFTKDDLEVVVMLQDARFMGEETSTLFDGNADNFDMREGFMKIKHFYFFASWFLLFCLLKVELSISYLSKKWTKEGHPSVFASC